MPLTYCSVYNSCKNRKLLSTSTKEFCIVNELIVRLPPDCGAELVEENNFNVETTECNFYQCKDDVLDCETLPHLFNTRSDSDDCVITPLLATSEEKRFEDEENKINPLLSSDDMVASVRKLQMQEEWSNEIIDVFKNPHEPHQRRLKRGARCFQIQNDLLYKKIFLRDEIKFALCIPKCMRLEVLQLLQNYTNDGQRDLTKEWETMKHNYYWPGIHSDMLQYVPSFENEHNVNQSLRNEYKLPHVLHEPETSSIPNDISQTIGSLKNGLTSASRHHKTEMEVSEESLTKTSCSKLFYVFLLPLLFF